MVNTKLALGIHILVFVEIAPENESLTSEIVAESIGTNPVVVRRMFSKLKTAGLLQSITPKRGLVLAKRPELISIYEVLKAVDPDNEIFAVHQNVDPKCEPGQAIVKAIESEFHLIQDEIEEKLKKKTLWDLIGKI